MIRKWLSLLLVVVMMLQSSITLADAYQFHISSSEHSDVAHNHSGTLEQNKEQSDNSIMLSFDCQHSCHAQGSLPLLLGTNHHCSSTILYSQSFIESKTSYSSHAIPPNLRPPIV